MGASAPMGDSNRGGCATLANTVDACAGAGGVLEASGRPRCAVHEPSKYEVLSASPRAMKFLARFRAGRGIGSVPLPVSSVPVVSVYAPGSERASVAAIARANSSALAKRSAGALDIARATTLASTLGTDGT